MARKLPEPRDLKRRPASVQPKILFVICCEGKNTEPQYFKDFASAHGNKLVKVEPIPAAGVPLTLVQRAIQENEQRQKIAARSKDSFSTAFQVWGVFDIDEHPNVLEAIDLARRNGINLGISNPCFDLWGLLHHIVRIPVQTGHAFHGKLDSHSRANWTLIPRQTGQ